MDNFCVFILTHGRPEKVITLDRLKKSGYTGKVYIVIDDEDKAAGRYYELFGDMVLMFKKSEVAKTFDEGGNFKDRRAIIYARNACFDLAGKVGCKYFIQLDDDYTDFIYKFDDKGNFSGGERKYIKNLDNIFGLMLDFYKGSPFQTIAMAQAGDFIGGKYSGLAKKIGTKRKAMNSFICDVDRPFQFVGRINEDVNTYTSLQRRGSAFLTILQLAIIQVVTQQSSGGMTDIYKDSGTYVKSFYSVMFCPSGVVVKDMGWRRRRLHHNVCWDAVAPKIIPESYKK
jgi:hypothetical protein